MVSIWKCRNPLTLEEREMIKQGIDLNMSYREIALHVKRSKSVVLREAKRLGKVDDYDPFLAQKDFEEKQKLVGISRS